MECSRVCVIKVDIPMMLSYKGTMYFGVSFPFYVIPPLADSHD